MPTDADVYASLRGALGALGLRWYVFGGQAAIIHGATRFTEDIDVTVDLGETTRAALVRGLQAQGCSLRFADEDFVEQTRVLPLVHEPSRMPIDLVLAGPGIEDMFFERVAQIDIEGQPVPVACAEDIVTMKILSARPKDLEDATAIVMAQADHFEEQRVRHLLGLLEQALDQSDLLPAFEACLARSHARA